MYITYMHKRKTPTYIVCYVLTFSNPQTYKNLRGLANPFKQLLGCYVQTQPSSKKYHVRVILLSTRSTRFCFFFFCEYCDVYI